MPDDGDVNPLTSPVIGPEHNWLASALAGGGGTMPLAGALGERAGAEALSWIHGQKELSARMGLWDTQRGVPTPEGMRQAGLSWGSALLGPIETWHGTPHTFEPVEHNPFGEFDVSKIGTGEGSQAYGRGMYLAESKGVAKSYKKQGEMTVSGFEGKPIGGVGPQEWHESLDPEQERLYQLQRIREISETTRTDPITVHGGLLEDAVNNPPTKGTVEALRSIDPTKFEFTPRIEYNGVPLAHSSFSDNMGLGNTEGLRNYAASRLMSGDNPSDVAKWRDSWGENYRKDAQNWRDIASRPNPSNGLPHTLDRVQEFLNQAKLLESRADDFDNLDLNRFQVFGSGNLYRAHINAPHESFMRWDRPVVDQPHVVEALNKIDPNITPEKVNPYANPVEVRYRGFSPGASGAPRGVAQYDWNQVMNDLQERVNKVQGWYRDTTPPSKERILRALGNTYEDRSNLYRNTQLYDNADRLRENAERLRDIISNISPSDISFHQSPTTWEHVTGENVYRYLEKTLGRDETPAALDRFGVPGNSYLDRVSRDEGEGTHNYVVFHPRHISIIGRNGESLPVTPVDHDPWEATEEMLSTQRDNE